jgi:hypothetical protein
MISGGDFFVFLVAVLIVIAFFVVMRRLMARAENESDSHRDSHPKH